MILGILNLLKSNDCIMVDKGFKIDDECRKRNICLIRPPFKRKTMKQFSVEQCTRSRGIASARVHIERVNERMKNFQIFKDELSWDLLGHIDDIATVIRGLVNLSSPILSDERFL